MLRHASKAIDEVWTAALPPAALAAHTCTDSRFGNATQKLLDEAMQVEGYNDHSQVGWQWLSPSALFRFTQGFPVPVRYDT